MRLRVSQTSRTGTRSKLYTADFFRLGVCLLLSCDKFQATYLGSSCKSQLLLISYHGCAPGMHHFMSSYEESRMRTSLSRNKRALSAKFWPCRLLRDNSTAVQPIQYTVMQSTGKVIWIRIFPDPVSAPSRKVHLPVINLNKQMAVDDIYYRYATGFMDHRMEQRGMVGEGQLHSPTSKREAHVRVF